MVVILATYNLRAHTHFCNTPNLQGNIRNRTLSLLHEWIPDTDSFDSLDWFMCFSQCLASLLYIHLSRSNGRGA